jgi:tetratricopeptide (TPR) repeat protein
MPRSVSRTYAALLLIAVLSAAQNANSTGPFETTSRLGRKLYALPDDGSIQSARKDLAADPRNIALVLKLSKAQAGKRQYREAIATCTTALHFAPNNADLSLERGHRELGLRDFKAGLADLTRAVQIAPSNLDAQYHLGMAHYFLHEFGPAAQCFRSALDLAKSVDSVIDCSNWTYVSLRRAGQTKAAALVLTRITPEMKNTEPHLYFYLRLLRFYQGALPENELLPAKPSGAADIEGELSFDTVNYGVGNWHLYNDHDSALASSFFHQVVKGYAWNAWGFIGSELELAAEPR